MKRPHLLLRHGQQIYDLFSAVSHLATSFFLQEQRAATGQEKVYVCSLMCCCQAAVLLSFPFEREKSLVTQPLLVEERQLRPLRTETIS